jgi:hypothetical protein
LDTYQCCPILDFKKKQTSNQRCAGSGPILDFKKNKPAIKEVQVLVISKTLKELLRFHERFDSFLSNYFNFFKK